MNGWLVALVIMVPILAFGMWLTFNALLVKWYGLDALKATPPIYKVFMRRAWFGPSPRSDSAALLPSGGDSSRRPADPR